MLAVVHEADSGPALLGEHARGLGIEVVEVLADLADPLAVPTTADGYDVLLVLGASPSVNDDHIRPWLDRELALLRSANNLNVPILGVCFGAQAMAVAFGGSVTRATRPEIGWFEVDTTRSRLIERGPWFEWHVDAITPPPQADVIATTEVCVQAYALGRHLAVQFHPEVTEWNVSEWCRGGADQLAQLQLQGTRLVEETRAVQADATVRAATLLDRFLEHAGLADQRAP